MFLDWGTWVMKCSKHHGLHVKDISKILQGLLFSLKFMMSKCWRMNASWINRSILVNIQLLVKRSQNFDVNNLLNVFQTKENIIHLMVIIEAVHCKLQKIFKVMDISSCQECSYWCQLNCPCHDFGKDMPESISRGMVSWRIFWYISKCWLVLIREKWISSSVFLDPDSGTIVSQVESLKLDKLENLKFELELELENLQYH